MTYIKLLRIPVLLLIIASLLIMHYCVAIPLIGIDTYQFDTLQLVLLIVSTVLIAAGGFVINDYYDLKIDEINKPLTRIVGNKISKHAAMNLYAGLSIAALIASLALGFFAKSLDFCFIFVTMIGLLWFYSSTYKRTLIAGNVIVALSIACIPFMVALFEGRFLMTWWGVMMSTFGYKITPELLQQTEPTITAIYQTIGYFSIAIFAWMLVHEIIRNLYEEEGERELECHTLPIVYGDKTAQIIASGIIIVINLVIITLIVLNFHQLKATNISYYICTQLAFSATLIYFLMTSERKKDYKICLRLVLLNIISILGYAFIFAAQTNGLPAGSGNGFEGGVW